MVAEQRREAVWGLPTDSLLWGVEQAIPHLLVC